MIELLKCKCADQKNRILRRGGLAATTVKFSTNGLPKLRSGLLLERKKDRLIAAYSLHCGRFSVTGLRLRGDHHWLGENGSLFRKPLMKIKDIHLPGKMLHLLVSCFTLGVKKQNHLVSQVRLRSGLSSGFWHSSAVKLINITYLNRGLPVNVSIIRVLFSIALCTARAS